MKIQQHTYMIEFGDESTYWAVYRYVTPAELLEFTDSLDAQYERNLWLNSVSMHAKNSLKKEARTLTLSGYPTIPDVTQRVLYVNIPSEKHVSLLQFKIQDVFVFDQVITGSQHVTWTDAPLDLIGTFR